MSAITHDLTADELAFLNERLAKHQAKGGRWLSVRFGDRRMTNPSLRIEAGQIVAATADGNYSTSEIVRGIHDAYRHDHERASAAAKKAAVTRAKRRERLVYVAARMLKENRLHPRDNCMICGVALTDPKSIARGIGSECWQRVLEALKDDDVKAQWKVG